MTVSLRLTQSAVVTPGFCVDQRAYVYKSDASVSLLKLRLFTRLTEVIRIHMAPADST